MGGVCGTQRVEDKCVHDFGEGKLGDLPVWILLLLLLLLLLILFFYFDTTIPVWVLVVCTRLFKVFPSLTILSFSSMVYGREYYGNMY